MAVNVHDDVYSSWPATWVSYYAVPLWLLQVGVPLKVLWGYSDATAYAVASQPFVTVASENPHSTLNGTATWEFTSLEWQLWCTEKSVGVAVNCSIDLECLSHNAPWLADNIWDLWLWLESHKLWHPNNCTSSKNYNFFFSTTTLDYWKNYYDRFGVTNTQYEQWGCCCVLLAWVQLIR